MIAILFIVYGVKVFHAYFIQYPLVSADYWGWQYGPSEILEYFIEKQPEYDQLFMTGDFNGPDVFMNFYTYPNQCPKCLLGGPDQFDSKQKQLFAVRVSEFEVHAKRHPELVFIPQEKVTLPDGKVEYMIGEFVPRTADQ
jgi:hypothetical protein